MADSEHAAARRLLDDENDYVSLERAAEILDVSMSTLYRLRTSKKLRSVKIDHRILIRRSWIDDFLNSAVAAVVVLLVLILLALEVACISGVEWACDLVGKPLL